MQITDPIADMLTRIRNAGNARHASVDVPASKMKKAIAQILLDEGYIKSFEVVEGNTQGIIRIALKYVDNRQKAITGIKRVSKPGLRVYAGAESPSPVCAFTPVLTSCPESSRVSALQLFPRPRAS